MTLSIKERTFPAYLVITILLKSRQKIDKKGKAYN